jgi:predicted O-methyltransferase YrrM
MKRLETDAGWTAIDDYITDCLVPGDPILDAALAASEAAGLPAINVAPNQGKLLMLLARDRRASHLGDRHPRRLQHDLARAGASP